MTAPDLGPCQCGPTHEHSDFEPHACVEADCACVAHRAPGAEPEAGDAADRQASSSLIIPADALNFAPQRAAQTAAWLDDITTQLDPTTAHRAVNDPIAICGLADTLETQASRGQFDPFDVLALAVLKLAAHTQPTPEKIIGRAKQRIRNHGRRR